MAQGLDGADPLYRGSAKIELHQRNRQFNIKLIQKKHYEVLIEDKKENLNLNKIMTELKKYKLNIYEASFLKNSLDDVFRKITQQK